MNRQGSSNRREFLAGAVGACILGGRRPVCADQASASPATISCAATRPAAPIRYRVSCAAYSYRKYLPRAGQSAPETIFDFVRLCSEWGCDGTEPTSYYFTQTDDAYLIRLKRQAFDLGLDITGTAVGNDFALPPGEELDRQIAEVQAWVDRSVLMGIPSIRIFAGRPKEGLGRTEAFAWIVEAIRRVCDYAGTRGVVLGIENHGFMTERAEDVLKIVDAVRHPWLGVNLDTGNFPDNPYENIALLAPRATTCQVKTEVRTGEGDRREPADLPRIVRIMRDAGYRGYLTLEYEGREEPRTDIPLWIDRLKKAIALAAEPP